MSSTNPYRLIKYIFYFFQDLMRVSCTGYSFRHGTGISNMCFYH